MFEKMEKMDNQVIRTAEINFEDMEQLEEIASPGFLGTVDCGC